MVELFSTYSFCLDHSQSKSFKQLLQEISRLHRQPQDNIQIFFVDSRLTETQIDSESDLLTLRYFVKNDQTWLKILIKRPIQQIYSKFTENQEKDYLLSPNDQTQQYELQRLQNQQTQQRLRQFKRNILKIQAKKKLKKMQNEEVFSYITNLNEITERLTFIRRPSIQRKSIMISPYPQSSLAQSKSEKIQAIVKRTVQPLVSAMAKQLSYQLIKKLKQPKECTTTDSISSTKTASQEYQSQL